ncbi:hypothetical protein BGZ65_001808 [Modicella reniformis]|uniref:Exoribonuclease phosphorolytic domain-containing protein n=1 Tax=Modicella reniformis TaxID=1440133 RepID=A0A9P6MIH1_9FUNG|nr:hypothetical protein BGZ65_001808 [Modicella reniformis]
MDRKRVPGPELSVAPLVEYPVGYKRWTPLEEKRHDLKRQTEDMRPIYLKTGLINQANGSAYIELEKTKLACGVYGPRPAKKLGGILSTKGTLNCEIKFATFSCAKRRSNVRVLLESDGFGSCLAAAITAASVALAHAGIEMLDLVAGCSASYIQIGPNPASISSRTSSSKARGSISTQIFMDADLEEEKYEQGAIVLAYMPSLNEITHVLQSGKAEGSTISKSVEYCVEACNKIYAVMHHALLESINENKEAL